jgi:hypothetical protein
MAEGPKDLERTVADDVPPIHESVTATVAYLVVRRDRRFWLVLFALTVLPPIGAIAVGDLVGALIGPLVSIASILVGAKVTRARVEMR